VDWNTLERPVGRFRRRFYSPPDGGIHMLSVLSGSPPSNWQELLRCLLMPHGPFFTNKRPISAQGKHWSEEYRESRKNGYQARRSKVDNHANLHASPRGEGDPCFTESSKYLSLQHPSCSENTPRSKMNIYVLGEIA